MTNMINVHGYGARHESLVCTVEFGSLQHTDSAEPTSRALGGTVDGWAAEEWAEPVTLADGRKATAYYLFDADSIRDNAEDYPWDADHCAWVELAP